MRGPQPVQDSHPFLILPENQLAHTACLRLVADPARGEFPLITLVGPPGSGKTHLAQLVVQEMLARAPRTAVVSLSANDFASQLHAASSSGKIRTLQERLRSQTELLVFEDLHRLEGRKESQQQLAAVLDDLQSQKRRVLITSRKSPGGIPRLSSRIINRCHGGVLAELEELSRGSRERLTTHFAETLKMPLPEKLIGLLAAGKGRSPRDLLRLVESVRSAGQRRKVPLDEALVRDILARSAEAKPTLSEITRIVARAYDAKVADLRSASRTQGLVVPRQVAMFLARELIHAEYKTIGDYFGGRNHATVIHACDRIRQLAESEAEIGVTLSRIRDDLMPA